MTGESVEIETDAAPAAGGVGPQLRAARERQDLSIEDVAKQTRIPQRHLRKIEAGEFADLAGRTYAIGFSKTYARLVGLDQDDVAAMVAAELDAQEPDSAPRAAVYQPGDPSRAPSAGLSWVSIGAGVILLIGLFFFMRVMFTPAAELPPLTQEPEPAATPAEAEAAGEAEPAVPAGGPVVFTALEEGIWVKFYDANGSQLMQKLMAEGESYTVPLDAEGPQVWTGRPDAFAITVGGRSIPKLAEEDRIMRDVPVTAEALLARGQAADDMPAGPAAQ